LAQTYLLSFSFGGIEANPDKCRAFTQYPTLMNVHQH